jgi:glycosyltransferase involved in cell wall biosynthesis
MKILVISFYYEPDLSAGSFRTASFVRKLKTYLTSNDIIEIVTTLPNRYHSFTADAKAFQSENGVTIKRIQLPPHQNAFFDQAFAFFRYFYKTLRYVRGKKYDIVFATSSRLFSAFLGAIIAKQKNIPLYLDIRDVFVDTMMSLLKKSKLKFIIPFFLLVEKFTMKNANKVNLISKGFLPYFTRKYKDCLYSFFPNGIDNEFLDFDYGAMRLISLNRRLVFTYTGNIGEGQGLEKIVPKIAQKYKNIEFRIIGDGGTKNILEKHTSNLDNVKLLHPVERKELPKFYKESDALFLHLNDYDAFKKVLPSKIFEYAATYKPIVAGVDGYAREFLETYLPGCLIFKPSDFDDFCQKFAYFTGAIDIEKRKDFINKFSRCSIMSKMVEDFLNLTTVSI